MPVTWQRNTTQHAIKQRKNIAFGSILSSEKLIKLNKWISHDTNNLQWKVTDTLTMLRIWESTYILVQYKIWSTDYHKIWVKVNIIWVSSMPRSKFSVQFEISGVMLYVQEKKSWSVLTYLCVCIQRGKSTDYRKQRNLYTWFRSQNTQKKRPQYTLQ